jgi:hypothetical protein
MKKIVLGLALVLFLAISNVVYAYGPGEGYSMGPWIVIIIGFSTVSSYFGCSDARKCPD